jgi:type II secretion system protein G
VKTLRNKNKSGFTLIELLVVIAIIGLLASVVLLALNGARAKARDAKRIADVRQLASAMELYFNDQNSYPTNASGILGETGGIVTIPAAASGGPKLNPNYIGLVPAAPSPADGATCGGAGQGSNHYYWVDNTGGSYSLTNSYTITFCLGATTGGYPQGGHTLTPAGIQ